MTVSSDSDATAGTEATRQVALHIKSSAARARAFLSTISLAPGYRTLNGTQMCRAGGTERAASGRKTKGFSD
jgi:hypothetical protein